MLAAIHHEKPDRVPISPDISNMIPAKLTGKPFWDIYLNQDPPLWKAYLEAVKVYDLDGWFINYDFLGPGYSTADRREFSSTIEKKADRVIEYRECKTPAGTLTSEIVYPKDNPPMVTRRWIKDPEKEFEHFKYFMPDPEAIDTAPFYEMRDEVGDFGIVGCAIRLPWGSYANLRDGFFESALLDYFDKPDLVREYARMYEEYAVRLVEKSLTVNPDEIVILASNESLSVISPDIFRDLDLSTLQRITKIADKAGVPTHLHICGRSNKYLDLLYNETDLKVMEPLERPPRGDVDLGKAKQKYGDKWCLKGNVDVIETMLYGTPHDVEKEVKDCIVAAGEEGAFILSTGDQCSRDTPDENLRAFVAAGKKYGCYR